MAKMLAKFSDAERKEERVQGPMEVQKRTKTLGEGRWVVLCDEPDCPLASDMNFGKEQCVFHFAADFEVKGFVTKWIQKHYRLIELAKFYDRFGVLDGEREVVLDAFNQACERFNFAPVPPEGHPYFIRPIDYVQALCQQAALKEKSRKAEERAKKDQVFAPMDDPYFESLPEWEKARERRKKNAKQMIQKLVNRCRSVEADSAQDRPF